MKSLRRLFSRTSTSIAGRDEDRLRSEIEEHLALQTDEFIRSGMTPEEARRQAILKFGAVESIKEDYRDGAGLSMLENFLRDFRFALRQLRHNPGFAWTAIVVLAIGVAASTAIFAFVDAALLRPLPYPDANRLVAVTESVALFPRANLSVPDYYDWKARNHVFRSFDFYNGQSDLLSTASGTEVVPGTRVSAGFFRTLGVVPLLGRDFRDGEDLPDAPAIALLSYATWQKRFGGRRDVVGQPVTLSGIPTTIIGVLPQEFDFAPAGGTEFWKAFHAGDGCDKRRSCHGLLGIARLKDGVTVSAALTEMKGIASQLEKEYPDSNKGQGAVVDPLSEIIVGDIRPILLMLLAGSGLLLVIACVNVSSLLLVRSERRRREINIRGALGASPGRLFLQFVTEGMVLVLVGVAAGLLLAGRAIHILLGLISANMLMRMPFLKGLGLNSHVWLFAAAVALLAVALFAVVPALRLPRRDLREEMEQGGRGAAGNWRRFGGKLVVVELATAMVLLVGAGLLGKSFYRLLHVETGFATDHLAMLRINAPDQQYKTDASRLALQRRVVDTISALPGVQSVGLVSLPPLSFNGNTDWIRLVGYPYNGEHNEVNERDVSAGFFETIRAKLIRGRFFREDEDKSKALVVIINKALADKYFPGEDPIGKKIGDTKLSPKSITEIVGVVDNVREGPLDSEIVPAEYHPVNQEPRTSYTVIARTANQAESVVHAMDQAIRRIDSGMAIFAETTMEQRMHDSQTAHLHRSAAWLVAGFAALALLLGVVGLYGVIAYSVNQRTREIGVRMALGAERRTIYGMVLSEAGWLVASGIVVGIAASLGAVSLMKKILFGVSRWDVSTMVGVALLLGVSALLASFFPARRAASVSPVEALRVE